MEKALSLVLIKDTSSEELRGWKVYMFVTTTSFHIRVLMLCNHINIIHAQEGSIVEYTSIWQKS